MCENISIPFSKVRPQIAQMALVSLSGFHQRSTWLVCVLDSKSFSENAFRKRCFFFLFFFAAPTMTYLHIWVLDETIRTAASRNDRKMLATWMCTLWSDAADRFWISHVNTAMRTILMRDASVARLLCRSVVPSPLCFPNWNSIPNMCPAVYRDISCEQPFGMLQENTIEINKLWGVLERCAEWLDLLLHWYPCLPKPQRNSLQKAQNVGCRKNFATNLWPFMSWVLSITSGG